MLQQTSASGVIIVEDDPIWFSPAGCEPLLRLLQSPVRAHPSHLCMRPCYSTHVVWHARAAWSTAWQRLARG